MFQKLLEKTEQIAKENNINLEEYIEQQKLEEEQNDDTETE